MLHTDMDTHPVGTGRAKRNPADRDVPAISDELAVARALTDLGHRLLVTTAREISADRHRPATLPA
jgi:hypothetical protein